jgi:hypothetical protein
MKGVRVVLPEAGRFVAKGFLGFPPSAVPSAENIRVLLTGAQCDEVPSEVRSAATWPDGSVKVADISFPVQGSQAGSLYFWVEWGAQTRRIHWQAASEAAVYFQEAEAPTPDFDMPAGTLLVRVEQHPDLWYYSYLVPTVGIIGILVWRKVRQRR